MRPTGDPLECRLAGGGSYNMLPEGEPVRRRLHEMYRSQQCPTHVDSCIYHNLYPRMIVYAAACHCSFAKAYQWQLRIGGLITTCPLLWAVQCKGLGATESSCFLSHSVHTTLIVTEPHSHHLRSFGCHRAR